MNFGKYDSPANKLNDESRRKVWNAFADLYELLYTNSVTDKEKNIFRNDIQNECNSQSIEAQPTQFMQEHSNHNRERAIQHHQIDQPQISRSYRKNIYRRLS